MLVRPMSVVLRPALTARPVMNSYAGPAEDDACYLFEAAEGMKYVCTSRPDELAFMMGLETKDLITGEKPKDEDLIECAEEWSHTGTPQWACLVKKGEPGSEADLESIGWDARTWSKRSDTEVSDDGACFIVSDEESPDPSKQWFFCSDPSDDEDMACEYVLGGLQRERESPRNERATRALLILTHSRSLAKYQFS